MRESPGEDMKTREEINWEDSNIEVEDFGGVKKLFWENPEWFENEMRDLGWQPGIPHGVVKWIDTEGRDITDEFSKVESAGRQLWGYLNRNNLRYSYNNAYARLARDSRKDEFDAWRAAKAEEERSNGKEYPYPYIGFEKWCLERCYGEWGRECVGSNVELETYDFGSYARRGISCFDEWKKTLENAAEKYGLNEDFPGLAIARYSSWQEYVKAVA